jgi:N-acyl-D-amino-acid deacylase
VVHLGKRLEFETVNRIDTLIRGARVIDGTGNPWKYGDVLISGDTILDIVPPGSVSAENIETVVDATGKFVCPGFIDIQSHSIAPLMRDGRCVSKITQGVTTEIMGEGWTPAPVGGRFMDPMFGRLLPDGGDVDEWAERAREWTRFRDWLEAMEETGVSPNVGSYLAGGTLRQYARGMDMGLSSEDELNTMRRVMAEAMEDGAFGVTYALVYPPDDYVDTDEIVEVCKVVAQYNGTYITHMRSESLRILEGLREALEIGERSGAGVEIYHLKAAGKSCWHLMPEVIRRITDARARGLDVTSDMYPYTASGTGLSASLPTWVSEGGRFYDNLTDEGVRKRIHEELSDPAADFDGPATSSGVENVMPIGFTKPENQQYIGKRLTEIAEMRGEHWIDTIMNLLISEQQRIMTIYHEMSEDNLRNQLQQPWIKISSDAGGMDPSWAEQEGPTHPRAYGTFTRVLGKYVREEGSLTWESAVRKMTSSVADRLSIKNRGILCKDMKADVVVFDPETVTDNATFEQPHQLSTGIEHVWVNGTAVVRDGEHIGATPGRFVKGPGAV